MNIKIASIVAGGLLLSTFILTIALNHSSSTKHSNTKPYQLMMKENDVFLFDTKTGQVWVWENRSRINGVAEWTKLEIPGLPQGSTNSSEIGRYQLTMKENDVFLFDTKTGQVWVWENRSRINGIAEWTKPEIPGLSQNYAKVK